MNISISPYLQSFSWVVFAKVGNTLANLAMSIWLIRYLGPSNYGIYAFAIAVTSIIAVISKLGLNQVLVIDLSLKPDNSKSLIITTLWLRVCAAIFCIILLNSVVFFLDLEPLTKVCIALLSGSMLFQTHDLFKGYYEVLVKGREIWKVEIIALFFSLCAKSSGIFFGASLEIFCLILLMEHIFTLSIFLMLRDTKLLFSVNGRFSAGSALSILRRSWPLLVSALSVSIYMRVDQVMLKSFVTSADVGAYSAAVRITESFNFFGITLCATFFPSLIKLYNNNIAAFNAQIVGLYSILLWVGSIFAASLSLFSSEIVVILLGSEFSNAGELLRIYSFSCIFVFVGLLSTKWMVLTDKRGFVLLVTCLGCICNIVLNIALIPLYGSVGAAYATLVSYSITTVFCELLFSNLFSNLVYKVRAVNPRYGIELVQSMVIKRGG